MPRLTKQPSVGPKVLLRAASVRLFEDIILDNPQIKAWVFGHCHESDVIHIGQAKVLEHSFGYYNANNRSFKPLHLEI